MGTTWSLRLDNRAMLPLDAVREAVEAALDRVVAQMSHWEADSILSRYNRAPPGTRHALPPEFAAVLRCALDWAARSGGALDPTVGPLVNLWGFGPGHDPDNETQAAPDASTLSATRSTCGWPRLALASAGDALDQPGDLTLDFSGIAKGFAVDHAVEALQAIGLTDLLLEVGGELRALGRRPGDSPWRIQVASGEEDASHAPLTVALDNLAIATSGDQWHRRADGSRHWSHTIDPRSGEPVDHALASVSVLHPECMQADALATVLTVLGPDEGLAFAEAHAIAACLAERTPSGLRTRMSTIWTAWTA